MHNHIEYVRPYFAENGGPIIMTQMENELSGPSNTPYVDWLGELATELKTGLPWCALTAPWCYFYKRSVPSSV